GFVASSALPAFDNTYFVAEAADFVAEAADFDGDGQTDLLIAQGSYDSFGYLQQYVNGGDRNLTTWQICYSRLRQAQGFQCVPWTQAGQGPTALHLAYDLDGDGRQDIYWSHDSYDAGHSYSVRSTHTTN